MSFSISGRAKDTLTYDASASGAWYPYFIENENGHEGILIEVVDYLLDATGIDGNRVSLPAKRTQRAFANGLIDFDFTSPAWLAPSTDTSGFIFSDPIIPIREHIIYLKGTSLPANLLTNRQIQKPYIGTVRGYLYHNENMFKRVDFRSEKEILLALSLKRINWGIAGDLTARYWATKLGVNLEIGPIHSDDQLHIRLQKEKAHLLPKINAAIKVLKQSGKLEQILRRYTHEAGDTTLPGNSATQ
ncbi:MAG: transporter substrate-binding domain-containing protein [Alteromonadaceae bacterium]|nr:transporter substrate-binding domain-containing protein [Alteromonadaceae bacterium]